MNLTKKGQEAFDYATEYFPNEWFSAAELSEKCGKKIAPAALLGVVSRGYMKKALQNPVKFTLNLNADIPLIEKKGCDNANLHKALKEKDDEFYTYYNDIKKECDLYKDFFVNKTIYLNCDSEDSQFWKYFMFNFNNFQIKKLIATYYSPDDTSFKLISEDGETFVRTPLSGNGDFASSECVNIFDEADIVITNPPFSLFRKLVVLLTKHNKDFILVGNENSVASTEIFPLIKDNKIFFGYNKIKSFLRPDGTSREFGNICWFTNLPIVKNGTKIELKKKYIDTDYPVYDNYEAINVDKVNDIPCDYYGIMGVPISYVNKHDKERFEILGLAAGNTRANGLFYSVPYTPNSEDRGGSAMIDGKRKYSRVFIRRKENA